MPALDPSTLSCSIARTITVLGDRWALLVLREAALGTTRFSDFKQRLGIASDVLTDRLQTLVQAGVLARASYQEEGSRARTEYRLTPAGPSRSVRAPGTRVASRSPRTSPVVRRRSTHQVWRRGRRVRRRKRVVPRPSERLVLATRGRR